MTSDSQPSASLLSIPREIRDAIWSLLFIKSAEQDPQHEQPDESQRDYEFSSFSRYPHMKGPMYRANRQISNEHRDLVTRKSNETILTIQFAENCDRSLPDRTKEHLKQRLTFPGYDQVYLYFPLGNWIYGRSIPVECFKILRWFRMVSDNFYLPVTMMITKLGPGSDRWGIRPPFPVVAHYQIEVDSERCEILSIIDDSDGVAFSQSMFRNTWDLLKKKYCW